MDELFDEYREQQETFQGQFDWDEFDSFDFDDETDDAYEM